MGFKPVSSGGDLWNFEEKKTLEGVYLSKQENVGINKSKMYAFKDPNDDNITFKCWGSTALDLQMDNVAQGTLVKIIYEGMFDSPKRPGKQYKKFTVEAWED